ncbi:potassium channel family protein [soil metagenome]
MPDIARTPVTRLELWEAKLEWPLAVIAVAFLVDYSITVLARPHGRAAEVLDAIMALLYLVFVIDYVARLILAPDRRRWFLRHLLDLAIVALPFLRPLRLLRLIVLFAAMQRVVGQAVRGRVIGYTGVCAVLLVYVASLAILEVERSDPASPINNFGDALWWSVSTITSVGYGDLAPVTLAGRLIAVLLMLGGISLIGVITATVASWIVQRVTEEEVAHQAVTEAHIDALRDEIIRLRERMDAGPVPGSQALSGDQ